MSGSRVVEIVCSGCDSEFTTTVDRLPKIYVMNEKGEKFEIISIGHAMCSKCFEPLRVIVTGGP